MFTWICPQCGREVPPAYNDCPDCSRKTSPAAGDLTAAGVANPQAPPQQPPPPPAYAPPPPQQPYYQQPAQAPQAPQAPPQGYYSAPAAPAHGLNLPVWLMTILVALAVGGVLFGIIALVKSNRSSDGNGPAPIAAVESPAAKPGAKTNPLQKYIEVTGVRFVGDPKNQAPMVKFLVINHSPADINGLAGNVTMWAGTQKSEEDAQGSFSFSATIGPYESKELTVPLNTKRKIYELADWQNITFDVQITAPAG